MKAEHIVIMAEALREAKKLLGERVLVNLDLTEKQARDMFYYCRKSRALGLGAQRSLKSSFGVDKGNFYVKFVANPSANGEIHLNYNKDDKGVVRVIVTIEHMRQCLLNRDLPPNRRFIKRTKVSAEAWEQILDLRVGQTTIISARCFDFHVINANHFFPEIHGRLYKYDNPLGIERNEYLIISRLNSRTKKGK